LSKQSRARDLANTSRIRRTMERVSRKVHTWSTWGKPKALLYQSEIKQGLDDLNKDLDHCATRFNVGTPPPSLQEDGLNLVVFVVKIVSQMDIVHRQREMGMVLTGNHAEIQDKLQQLLDRTQDIQKIVRQPERSITSDMLSIQEAIHADVAGPEQQHSLQERLLKIHRQTELLPPMIDCAPYHLATKIRFTYSGYSDWRSEAS
jgi:hypothetical protein